MVSKSKRKLLRAAKKSRSKARKASRRRAAATRKDDKKSKRPDPQPQMRHEEAPPKPPKVDPNDYAAGTITYLGEGGERQPIDPAYPPVTTIGGVEFKMNHPVPVQLMPPGLVDQLRQDERFVLGTGEGEQHGEDKD